MTSRSVTQTGKPMEYTTHGRCWGESLKAYRARLHVDADSEADREEQQTKLDQQAELDKDLPVKDMSHWFEGKQIIESAIRKSRSRGLVG